MKKILPLILTLFLSMQLCLADEQTMEDIDSYFVEEPQQSQELHGGVEYNQEGESIEDKNAVHLDSTEVYKSINFSKPKSIESKSLITNSKKPTFGPIQDELEAASKFSSQEYDIRPISTTYAKKYGNFKLGTMYNSSLDSASMNYSTSLFAKYEGKYLALSGGFSKSTNSNYDSYNDRFYIAPEWKITKRLSLLDVMQSDVSQINKKNEIVLRYTPSLRRYADDVEFEVAAGQSFFEDAYVKSSVRFSTRFKL